MELREALENAIGEVEKSDQEVTNDKPLADEPSTVDGGIRENSTSGNDGQKAEPSSTVSDTKPTGEGKPASVDTKSVGNDGPGPEQSGDDSHTIEVKAHRVDRPPISWKGQAKGEWNNLPLHVRQEVHRRDIEVEKVLQETAPVRKAAQEFQETVAPYMARINGFGVTPTQAVQQLLAADYALATSSPEKRADYMATLIDQYGIDVTLLDRALTKKLKPNAPTGVEESSTKIREQIRQELLQEFAPVISIAQQQQLAQQQALQRQQEEAQTAVQSMSLDPDYPHFDEVRLDMADIIELGAKRGLAITPKEAYDKAVALNPKLSNQIQATDAHIKAQQALNASSSVSGSPARGGATTVQHDGSIRGALEAAFANVR